MVAQLSDMQCSAVQLNAITAQCMVVTAQCIALHNKVKCMHIALQHLALKYIAVHQIALNYIELHFSTIQMYTSNCIARCIVVKWKGARSQARFTTRGSTGLLARWPKEPRFMDTCGPSEDNAWNC